MRRPWPATRALAAVTLAATALAARAAHPLVSEDTGTQGTGNAELELGFGWAHEQGAKIFEFQPQLSYGASPTVDLIGQPSYLVDIDPSSGQEQGIGDTNLDFKWRFYGSSPLTLGVRAGFEVPTAVYGLGLPGGDAAAHMVLVATFDFAPVSVNANVGYTRVIGSGSGTRLGAYHVSGGPVWQLNDHEYLVLDLASDSNPDPAQPQWDTVALAGFIYTVHPGLDLDIGYLVGLNGSSSGSQWLWGITYRWAP